MELNGKYPQWLDDALKNETLEHRLVVHEFILRYGIETNHEFYVLFVALGHLKVLILAWTNEYSVISRPFWRKDLRLSPWLPGASFNAMNNR